MLSKQAKKRLTTLIKYMERLPKKATKHFNMNASWASHYGPHALSGEVTRESLMDCGTSACAMGWAASIPSFRKAGLRLEWTKIDEERAAASSNCDKAALFFDISDEQFWSLFNNDQDTDTTPKRWARRARELVREWNTP